MSDKRDRIMGIFIEESMEVIQLLETEIMSLEETPWDKSIINEIFRGVHTLKGNANSFGFTNLGNFVHYFEDLLDFYRNQNNNLNEEMIELFFSGYDIIKNVFEMEIDGNKEYPPKYNEVLEKIKSSLKIENVLTNKNITNNLVEKHHYHHAKFDKEEILQFTTIQKELILSYCKDGLKLFNIIMEFDSDIYLRGYNHLLFFKLFEEYGIKIKSYWYINVPELESFNCEDSFINKISLYLASSASTEDINDVFEFIAEDYEVSISIVDCNLFDNENKKLEIKENNIETEIVEANKEIVEEDISVNNTSNLIKEATVTKSIRIESLKLDDLFDSIGELVIAQSFIDQNELIRGLNNTEINQYLNMLNKITRLIQTKVMNLRMIPIKDTFLKMKRVARDVSKKTHKEIELVLSGEDTEIDKTMVDSLSEPLIHLIRNAIDHGIENNVQDRLVLEKAPIGIIHLSAMHKGSSFIIEIKDDGKGINPDIILEKAINKGIASKDIEYSKEEILQFIFLPGFSTASSVTDISGRGVGLDAVKKSIDHIKGKIQLESEINEGSTFRIILPLTLAIIDGMSVKVGSETFILPTLSVVESFRVTSQDIQTVRGKGEFINFRGEILPVIKLNNLLEIGDDEDLKVEESTLICVEHERGKYVLQIKELLGRQQVVIKPLNKRLANVKEISGAAIMGNGSVALILNIEGIRNWLDEKRIESNI